eukprot:snap_masked-scaffold_4-processed-gene-16.44-mRNA-1 protein AED:1.00 eAED:1.00 QI:0/-1/0/0/-1/1/1/0/75
MHPVSLEEVNLNNRSLKNNGAPGDEIYNENLKIPEIAQRVAIQTMQNNMRVGKIPQRTQAKFCSSKIIAVYKQKG